MSAHEVVWLPGDGIGPEVAAAGRRVLEAVADRAALELHIRELAVGGAAIDAQGEPLPSATLAACRAADAVFLGAVGGPAWRAAPVGSRPEDGLLALREDLGLFANLRPVVARDALAHASPLRAERIQGTDILIVRELTGGIYFGPRREQGPPGPDDRAHDTMVYRTDEVARVAHVAFRAARDRRRRVTSVDKANVLASMRLWRRTVEQVAARYPEVALEHELVDAMAMKLVADPKRFDVVLAPNLFGDILSDQASAITGSLGMLPSASIGDAPDGSAPGLFEPVHGSAPDIAGRGVANPLGAISSVALLLRHGLGRDDLAAGVETAVARTLDEGLRTSDLAGPGDRALGTDAMADAVLSRL